MNCEQFQDQLFEYVEGSLAARQQGAADGHLTECVDCRLRLQQEQMVAQTLARGFRQSTERLALPPDFAGQLLRETRSQAPVSGFSFRDTLLRFAWPVAMSACVLIACIRAGHFFPGTPSSANRIAEMAVARGGSEVSIDFSYRLPTWQFHREGNRVVDTLSYETVVASGKLQPGGPDTIPQPQERKMPL